MSELQRLHELARSGDPLATRQLARLARRTGDRSSLILASSLLGDQGALLDIAANAWRELDHEGLELAMASLGLRLESTTMECLHSALEDARERAPLARLEVDTLLETLVRARRLGRATAHATAAARSPPCASIVVLALRIGDELVAGVAAARGETPADVSEWARLPTPKDSSEPTRALPETPLESVVRFPVCPIECVTDAASSPDPDADNPAQPESG